ncbi:ArsR/SmtB family transcription factor [Marinitenerispora sediminis]|uniref:ArsR/SmtB family transcription factor n=1 Tax=Marinitenerispora sediminis TaxID=1931232 RepID=UPI001F22625B|nr:helix-turn-helix domain-containing protein [Marinitenerispora sediminis]
MHNGALPLRRDGETTAGQALAALLGSTRAAALEAIAPGRTTGELARRLHLSPGAASHHTRVLRDAGLVVSVRDGLRIVHTLTPLGLSLLAGAEPHGAGPSPRPRPGDDGDR